MVATRRFDALAGLTLPAGGFVGDEDGPLIWLSDAALDMELIAGLRARHTETGLWPVLVGDHNLPAEWWPTTVEYHKSLVDPLARTRSPHHPFASHSYTHLSSAPGRLQAEARLERPQADVWLAEGWAEEVDDNRHHARARDVSAHAPRGATWPGLAPAAAPLADPSLIADWLCERILAEEWLHDPRLALMPGESSGAALAASWWTPPGFLLMASRVNVLRSWEERFGARVVALKPDTLYLSVSAPPVTREHAAHLACEHLAFCTDAVWQSSDGFEDHVETILGAPVWEFWWD